MRLRKKSFVSLGILFWFFAIVFALLPSWPHLYYRLFPQTSGTLASTIASTPAPRSSLERSGVIAKNETSSLRDSYSNQSNPESLDRHASLAMTQPDIDPSLPKENGIIIDKIGVQGLLHEGTDWESILKLGVWRIPDFGSPEDNSTPIILAAHRWGYLSWSNAFRKLNSFFNLPKLKSGDEIRLIWNQRQYTYQVYSASEGAQITDYSANLILYTCQLWNSPIRIFVYAKRVY